VITLLRNTEVHLRPAISYQVTSVPQDSSSSSLCSFHPCNLVPHFHVSHFQSPHRRLELQLGKLSFHVHVIDVLDMCVHVKLEKNSWLPSRIEVRPTALPHAPWTPPLPCRARSQASRWKPTTTGIKQYLRGRRSR